MRLRYSPRYALLLSSMCVLGVGIIYQAAMPSLARLMLFLFTSMSLFYYLARDALMLLPDSWCEVTLDQGAVTCITRDGEKLVGLVENRTIVSSYLIVLRVRPKGHWLTISRVIFPDAMNSESYRKLCVRLRLE